MLLDFIPKGKENAVTKGYLMNVTGLSERNVRSEIQRINEQGKDIICCENGKGYYRPATKEEAERYIRYNHSYLVALAKKDRAMRRAADNVFSDQVRLEL